MAVYRDDRPRARAHHLPFPAPAAAEARRRAEPLPGGLRGAARPAGREDHLGGFAVTAGIGIDDAGARRFEADNDDYSAILLKALADRLAEAFAEHLHLRVRREFWGYAPAERPG